MMCIFNFQRIVAKQISRTFLMNKYQEVQEILYNQLIENLIAPKKI